MDTQTYYQRAVRFAAGKHADKGQTIPGTGLPYVVHLSNVSMEVLMASANSQNFDVDFAVQVALLHDVLEDTDCSVDELSKEFGAEISIAVGALTKNDSMAKPVKNEPHILKKQSLSSGHSQEQTNILNKGFYIRLRNTGYTFERWID